MADTSSVILIREYASKIYAVRRILIVSYLLRLGRTSSCVVNTTSDGMGLIFASFVP